MKVGFVEGKQCFERYSVQEFQDYRPWLGSWDVSNGFTRPRRGGRASAPVFVDAPPF